MKFLNRNTFKLSVFIALFSFSVWHEYLSIKLSTKGHYTGKVIEKVVSEGKSSSVHYLYVSWDGIGNQSIIVHPVTYKMTNIGDRFCTELAYMPIIGAVGMVYVPDSGEYGVFTSILGVLSKIACFILTVQFVIAQLKANRLPVIKSLSNV